MSVSDHQQDFDTEMTDGGVLKRPSSPSHSDRSSNKSQRTKQDRVDEMDELSVQPGSTLSAKAPAFVPSTPTTPTTTTTTTMPKIPAKVEANLYKLIEAGLSDTNINARLASTAARHDLKPYQFTSSQLVLARANHAALKNSGGALPTSSSASSSAFSTTTPSSEGSRPVKPIPAKPLSMRAGAKTYLPEQAKVPKTKEERENSRRLIVVLSKVSERWTELSRRAFALLIIKVVLVQCFRRALSSHAPRPAWKHTDPVDLVNRGLNRGIPC